MLRTTSGTKVPYPVLGACACSSMAKSKKKQERAKKKGKKKACGRARGRPNKKFSEEQLAFLMEMKDGFENALTPHKKSLKDWYNDAVFPDFFEKFAVSSREERNKYKRVRYQLASLTIHGEH